jgi:T5SS/PEP-CTERM-associated repeat protein/autotransporter-associated beta strand protein
MDALSSSRPVIATSGLHSSHGRMRRLRRSTLSSSVAFALRLTICVFLSGAACDEVLAQCATFPSNTNKEWRGGVGGNWDDASNWNPTGEPVALSSRNRPCIDNGSGPTVTTAGNASQLMIIGTIAGSGGTLTVLSGGVLTLSSSLTVGQVAGTFGDVLVRGPSAQLNVGAAIIGNRGEGTLLIDGGGVLNATATSGQVLQIGREAGSTGTVTVTGAGSQLLVPRAEVNVGLTGNGSLNVLDGAQASIFDLVIGRNSSVGNVLVDGAGSRLDSVGGVARFGRNDSNQMTLANGGTFSAIVPLSVIAGSINIGAGGEPGTLDVPAVVGATVTVNSVVSGGTGRVNFNHDVAGLGFSIPLQGPLGVSQQGPGTTILLASNTYSGGTFLDSGVLQVSADANLGDSSGALNFNGGTFVFGAPFDLPATRLVTLGPQGGTFDTPSGTSTVGGVMGGAGGLTKLGTGTLVLANNNTYQGATLLQAGTLQIGAGGTLGNLAGDVSNAGSLVFDRSDAFTYAGSISGSGSLTQQGTGTTILTGSHTYLGGTAITRGTLQLGDGGITGRIEGPIDIADDAFLAISHSDLTDVPFELGQVISGAGGVRLLESGTVILSGMKTYTGPTSVEAGELIVSSLASELITVDSGARLTAHAAGSSMSGNVVVHGGGTLNPAGLLQLGALSLESGSLLEYRLGVPTGAPGSENNDRIGVAGNLFLGGATLNITNIGGFSQGVYRLFDYGGSLTGTAAGLALGSFPEGFNAIDFTVQTAVPQQVNLVVSAGGLSNQWWDGTQTLGNNAIDGGDGTWTLPTSNWTNADGGINALWEPGFAIFAGTGGTATLAENIPIGGMQFLVDGYLVTGGAGEVLQGDPDTVVRVDRGVTATVAAPLNDGAGGPARLVKTAFGTLVLAGASGYSGGTRIEGGAVQVAADANLGAASGALTFLNGALHTTASFASARTVEVLQRAVFRTDAGTELQLTGNVSGDGQLFKQDAGTLALSAGNSYRGGTTVASGTLRVAADSALGDASGPLVLGGPDRLLRVGDALGIPGGTAGPGDSTLQFDATFNLAATRAIRLDESGGTIDTNGFDTTISQGIGGEGGLTKAGEGTLTLAGNNRYVGGTAISGGTLRLGAGGTSGSVIGDVGNNGTLVFERSDDILFANAISGNGSVIKRGGNTLGFTGIGTYTGDTIVAQGRLLVDGSLASTVRVEPGATLGGNGTIGALNNAGLVAPGASIGTLTITGNFAQAANGAVAIELDDRGSFDRLVVGGAATLAGNVQYLPDATSTFASDLLYTWLPAAGGVSGTFANPTQEYAGVTLETIHNADNVQVRITSKALDPDGTDLDGCIGSLQDARRTARDTQSRALLGSLVRAPAQEFAAAALGLCARDPSALVDAVNAATGSRFAQLGQRIAQVHRSVEDPASGGLFDSYRLREGLEMWLRTSYQDGKGDQRNLFRPGYDSSNVGLVVGVDLALHDAGVVGAYMAHDNLDLDYRGFDGDPDIGEADSEMWSLGMYGSWWSVNRWFVQGMVEYGWHDIDSTRDINLDQVAMRTRGARDAHALAASAVAGYNFTPADGWLVQPQLIVRYERFDDGAYAEQGAGLLDLTYGDLEAETVRGELGVAVRKSLPLSSAGISEIHGYANYIHDDPQDDRQRTAEFVMAGQFTVLSEGEPHDGVRYGLGFEHTWDDNKAIQVVFDIEDYGPVENQSAALQFRKRF